MSRDVTRGVQVVAIACLVLAVIAGTALLADRLRFVVLLPLWTVHGVVLVLLLRRLGARESSTYAALWILGASVMSVHVVGVAREGLELQRRGEETVATVVRESREPAEGRKGRGHLYELERKDGTRVPGPALLATTDRFDAGETVTVIADPRGVLRPQTPGDADVTGEVLSAAGLAAAAVGCVGWMGWRGRVAERQRAVTEERTRRTEEQEQRLRRVLRAPPAGRRAYIEVDPRDYPDVTHRRAARIAWEAGLKAEAAGEERGVWRFAESVAEEVCLSCPGCRPASCEGGGGSTRRGRRE